MLLFEIEVRVASRVLGQELLTLWQVFIHMSTPVSFWGLPRLVVSKKKGRAVA